MVVVLERVARYLDYVYYETGWSVADHLSYRFSNLAVQCREGLELDGLSSCIDDFADLYYDSIVRVGCLVDDGESVVLAINEEFFRFRNKEVCDDC